jgi:hypothetical protein
MVNQTLELQSLSLPELFQEADRIGEKYQALDIQSIPTPPIFTYIITLINRKTEDEQSFQIETLTDSFTSVLNEIHWQRVERGLLGYEIFEVLDCNLPF